MAVRSATAVYELSPKSQLALQSLQEQDFDVNAIFELMRLLAAASSQLKSGIFNNEVVQALSEALEKNGPLLEKLTAASSATGSAVRRAFAVFFAAVDNQSLLMSNRIALFELIVLRANKWKSHKVGTMLMEPFASFKLISQGAQTPLQVYVAATNTTVDVTSEKHILYKDYVNGPGIELTVSGWSSQLVAENRVLLESFFKSDFFFEGLKSTALQLKLIHLSHKEVTPTSPPLSSCSIDGSYNCPPEVESYDCYPENEFAPASASSPLSILRASSSPLQPQLTAEANKLTPIPVTERIRRTHFLRSESDGDKMRAKLPVTPMVINYEKGQLMWLAQRVHAKSKPPGWDQIVKKYPKLVRRVIFTAGAETSTPSSDSTGFLEFLYGPSKSSQEIAEAYESYNKNELPPISSAGRIRRTHFLRSALDDDGESQVEQTTPLMEQFLGHL